MSCPRFEDRLHDYAGGYLSGRARQEVDEHLLVCASCRDDLTALRALVEDLSGLPRSIEAPEEIWSATKEAVQRSGRSARAGEEAEDAPGTVAGEALKTRTNVDAGHGAIRSNVASDLRSVRAHSTAGLLHPQRSVSFPRWLFRPAPLAAAASLVLVAAMAAFIVLRQSASTPGTTVAGVSDGADAQDIPGTTARDLTGPDPAEPARIAPAGLVPPDLEATEAEFSRAAENLLAALEAQRDRIPPETLALVEENLRAINEAIIETHRAMESDPGNARLGRLMRAMYHTKMRLLQGAAEIPSS